MLRIALEGDAAGVLAGLRAEGFVKPGMDIDPQELLDYLLPFVEPLEPRSSTSRVNGCATCSRGSGIRARRSSVSGSS